jgi:hypothetical protein
MKFPTGLFSMREVAAPATPASGTAAVYVKSDGLVYTKDDAGLERLMTHAVEAFPFYVSGSVGVVTGSLGVVTEGNYVVETVRIRATTAPTGSALTVDVNKNGTSIYAATQANRPSIAAGANAALGGTPDTTTFALGDVLTVDVDAVGSTISGSNLSIVVRLRRVS